MQPVIKSILDSNREPFFVHSSPSPPPPLEIKYNASSADLPCTIYDARIVRPTWAQNRWLDPFLLEEGTNQDPKQTVLGYLNLWPEAKDYVQGLSLSPEQRRAMLGMEQKSPDWLKARMGRLTASNFGVAMGLNFFQSRHQLLAEQVFHADRYAGQTPEKKQAQIDQMNQGTHKEPWIRDMYSAASRSTWTDAGHEPMEFRCWEEGICIPADWPWLGGSPDGLIAEPAVRGRTTQRGGRSRRGLLEIKCRKPGEWSFYSGGLPAYYWTQIMGLMGFLQCEFCDFVVHTSYCTQVTRYEWDAPTFWNELIPRLNHFYWSYMLPATLLLTKGIVHTAEEYMNYVCGNTVLGRLGYSTWDLFLAGPEINNQKAQASWNRLFS